MHHAFVNCIHVSILQTIYTCSYLYLVKLSSCKLFIPVHICILQIVPIHLANCHLANYHLVTITF